LISSFSDDKTSTTQNQKKNNSLRLWQTADLVERGPCAVHHACDAVRQAAPSKARFLPAPTCTAPAASSYM